MRGDRSPASGRNREEVQELANSRQGRAARGVSNKLGEGMPSASAVAHLRSSLDRVPEIRWQRVAILRRAIAQGQFAISPERIAATMLAEIPVQS